MLDLRLPLGWLFIIIGTILVVYGFTFPAATIIYDQTINLNVIWGLLMAAFGLSMCLLIWRNRWK